MQDWIRHPPTQHSIATYIPANTAQLTQKVNFLLRDYIVVLQECDHGDICASGRLHLAIIVTVTGWVGSKPREGSSCYSWPWERICSCIFVTFCSMGNSHDEVLIDSSQAQIRSRHFNYVCYQLAPTSPCRIPPTISQLGEHSAEHSSDHDYLPYQQPHPNPRAGTHDYNWIPIRHSLLQANIRSLKSANVILYLSFVALCFWLLWNRAPTLASSQARMLVQRCPSLRFELQIWRIGRDPLSWGN